MPSQKPRHASDICITIPIKNPDSRLGDCIRSISSQDINHDLCLLLISSGHKQNQLSSLINEFTTNLRIFVESIPPTTFQHGRTRNLAVTFVDAEYYVFLTQDAVPANTNWLRELIDPLLLDSDVAGSYSQHIAHENHSIFRKSELEIFFSQLSTFSMASKDSLSHAKTQRERDLITFFSNNSSCIRGSLFKHELPFPEVDFAEDQAWSVKAIEKGYKKAFSFNSVVRHSHELNIRETFGRGIDEAKSFRVNHDRRIMEANPLSILRSSFGLVYQDLRQIRGNDVWGLIKNPIFLAKQLAGRVSQSLGMYVGSSERLTKVFQSWSRDFGFKKGI